MKTTKNKKTQQIAIDFLKISKKRKELQKRETELKTMLLVAMENASAMNICGSIIITSIDATRSKLNKQALELDYGKDFINEYTEVTLFQKFNVQKVA